VIDLKQINVPVFLVYAGIIHAIGLALLMPMLVTLPGPGGAIAPKVSSVDVELAPAEADSDLTSALPAAPRAGEDVAQRGRMVQTATHMVDHMAEVPAIIFVAVKRDAEIGKVAKCVKGATAPGCEP
jgi:hypothetical protein